jgi:RHS repeat-associated protein
MKSTPNGQASTVYYFHPDHLGSTNLMTNSSGNVIRTTKYGPYGATWDNTGTKDNAHKFTGQILDDDTGLYYYNARYYDPVLCKFITPDTLVQDPYDPQSLNRYSYCLNNPVKNVDPTGHYYWSTLDLDYNSFATYDQMTVIDGYFGTNQHYFYQMTNNFSQPLWNSGFAGGNSTGFFNQPNSNFSQSNSGYFDQSDRTPLSFMGITSKLMSFMGGAIKEGMALGSANDLLKENPPFARGLKSILGINKYSPVAITKAASSSIATFSKVLSIGSAALAIDKTWSDSDALVTDKAAQTAEITVKTASGIVGAHYGGLWGAGLGSVGGPVGTVVGGGVGAVIGGISGSWFSEKIIDYGQEVKK